MAVAANVRRTGRTLNSDSPCPTDRYRLCMELSKESIRDDLTAAMKAKDVELMASLRMLLAAVGNAEVAGKEQTALSSDQIITLVRAETKKRNDSAVLYSDNGRAELATKELAEAKILSRYLPAELTDEALGAVIAKAVAAAAVDGNEGPKAIGAVMMRVKEQLGASVDGNRMAAAVKAALAPH